MYCVRLAFVQIFQAQIWGWGWERNLMISLYLLASEFSLFCIKRALCVFLLQTVYMNHNCGLNLGVDHKLCCLFIWGVNSFANMCGCHLAMQMFAYANRTCSVVSRECYFNTAISIAHSSTKRAFCFFHLNTTTLTNEKNISKILGTGLNQL